MREAIASAEVGDEQEREDPTVLELEQRMAALLGHDEAVYLPTATMANQIALAILGERGTELVVEESAHLMVHELGGAAYHSGLQTRGVPGRLGRFSPEQIEATTVSDSGFHTPRTSVVAVENTHNTSGGTIWPLDELQAVLAACREHGLAAHLDGARLFNAAVALGVPPADLAGGFDTVTVCLSKGLGCPLGALIAGSAGLMGRARLEKHRFGGAMRQAGVVAASGLYALDHERARRLAVGWQAQGLPVDLERVQTNFVQVDVGALEVGEDDAVARLSAAGVALSRTMRPGVIRAVTHLDVDDDDIDRAIEIVPRALGVAVAGV